MSSTKKERQKRNEDLFKGVITIIDHETLIESGGMVNPQESEGW